jgi:NitT/TauT family transport system substrate-binding protein
MPGYHLPLFAADATGIWERHGLDVELVDPFPGPDNAKAVAAGRYDACLTSVAHYARARREEPELAARFVFMVARRPHIAAFFVEGRPAEHGRPISDFADLAGASFVGETQSPFVRDYLAILRRLGIEPGRPVPLPYEHQFAALAAGEADVGIDFLDLRPRFDAAARSDQRIGALPFHRAGVELYGSGLVVSDRLLAERPETVQGLTAALRDALLATRDEPALGLEPLLARFPETDPARALAGWEAGAELVFGDEIGTMDAATWRQTLAHHGLELEPDEVADLGVLV